MIEYNEIFDDYSILPIFMKPQNDPFRWQVQFCCNLIANWISPCKQEFPEVQIKRQILDQYLKDIYNITSHYGVFTIKIASPKPNHKKHQIQTDQIDIEFSKVFTDYIKNIQHQNSQWANLLFTNNIFSIISSDLSILELKKYKVTHQFKHPDIQL